MSFKQKNCTMRDKTIFDGVVFKFFFKYFYRAWFKLSGWQTTSDLGDGAGVTIAAPHTSNWDFFYALGVAILLDIKIYFSIKKSWCELPIMGSFMLWLGGIPIDRSASGQVDQIKTFVKRHKNERIFFLFTPEGTRGGVAKWKTGFYHVAKDCGLPIFLAKVDYRDKMAGVFHTFQLTQSKADDIDAMQESYKSVCGRYHEKQFPAYAGPLHDFSQHEARVMQALYSLRGMATQAEIAAKAKFEELSTEMLDFLIDKGILERQQQVADGKSVTIYHLTLAGNGCLLHLRPSLA